MAQLKLTLRRTVLIPADWCSGDEWDEIYSQDIELLKGLFAEDLGGFYDDLDPLRLIESAEWVE